MFYIKEYNRDGWCCPREKNKIQHKKTYFFLQNEWKKRLFILFTHEKEAVTEKHLMHKKYM